MVEFAFERSRVFRALAVIACHPSQGNTPDRLAALNLDQADWLRVGIAAVQHRLVPSLLAATEIGAGLMPVGTRRELVARQREVALQAMVQVQTMHELFSRLADEGIRALAIKGTLLSMQLYGRVDGRMVGDIDILVDPLRYGDAKAALAQMGFVYRPTDLDRALFNQKDVYHEIFASLDRRQIVELHSRLTYNRLLVNWTFDDLWAARMEHDLAGLQVAGLGPVHLAPYLSLHGLGHGWERLRWLADVALLAVSGTLADMFHRDSRLDAGAVAVLHALSLSRRWFGLELPPVVEGLLKANRKIRYLDALVRANYVDPAEAVVTPGRETLHRYLRGGLCRYAAQQLIGTGLAYRIEDVAFGLRRVARRLVS